MTFRLSCLLWMTGILAACSTVAPVSKKYTDDDRAVFDLVERLKKNPADAEAAGLLPDAYRKAAATRQSITVNQFNTMPSGDRWMEIYKELRVMEQMYQDIRSVPAANKAVPDPWNPAPKMEEALHHAAEEYYTEGSSYLNYNNRAYARKAYESFAKADKAYPGYRDVKEKMAIAADLAIVKVIIQPVNYHNYGWSYWGLNNDWLQYQMVRDLNSMSYNDARFFTENDARQRHIQPDRVVDLEYNDFFIGTISNRNYTINRSAQVQTGQTKSVPPKPVYTTVYATVYVQQRLLQSRASLSCRIYDRATGRNILFDRFPATYNWRQERATYQGDKRALQSSDWLLINNRLDDLPPSRSQVAERLIRDSYQLLLSRIRDGIRFSD